MPGDNDLKVEILIKRKQIEVLRHRTNLENYDLQILEASANIARFEADKMATSKAIDNLEKEINNIKDAHKIK